MNSIKTIMIENQMHPVALTRTSIRVSKDSSQEDIKHRSNSTSTFTEQSNHHPILQTRRGSHQATKININTTNNNAPHKQDNQPKQIKLVISNNNNNPETTQRVTDVNKSQDSYLTTLIEEYQASLNRKDCDNTSCYRFKLLSYKISQTLFERITELKEDLELEKNNSTSKKSPMQNRTGFQSSKLIDHTSNSYEVETMDKDSLLSVVSEKDKRIQDLERLVEDQRRLRVQDASQVEEKAAKIKEWVANKLKELEYQNRQLRDQNKKQKETVESLSSKLATMSPLSSPRRVTGRTSDSVQYINQTSPIEAIDIDKSLKTRRPQLKKSFQPKSSSSEDENQNVCVKLDSGSYQLEPKEEQKNEKHNDISECSPSRNGQIKKAAADRCESPVYDSVTIEQINRRTTGDKHSARCGDLDYIDKAHSQLNASSNSIDTPPPPPPPPLHQSDKWELQLYNLADKTFSTLIKQHQVEEEEKHDGSFAQLDSLESTSNSEKEVTTSRKSSSSFKNDITSIVKPSYTTIDGDNVVESFHSDLDIEGKSSLPEIQYRPKLYSSSQRSSDQLSKLRKESIQSCENLDKPSTPSLFDSPMRSRSGKDNILRTQSVRRNPTPEKLYDFILSDLVKRGYLVKPGALKNHSRWFVLKNFHLYSYKCESEETTKATPNMSLKLDQNSSVFPINHSGEATFPFKITYSDKTIQLIADSAEIRDEWIRILTLTINMSDIDSDALRKDNSTHEGLMSVTRHGHTKRCYATLINHVVFFLKSLTDPAPMSYLSIKGATIREITDNYDYDLEEQELIKRNSSFQDCSLAIYPKYSMTPDPVYITLGGQLDTDKWFYYLSIASGLDQSYGTPFERTLTKLMVNNSVIAKKYGPGNVFGSDSVAGCLWRDQSVMLYDDRAIVQPLTSLPNETLRIQAIEMFKSILLFTQVPLEPVAIDYHVSLLQNCLGRFLTYPALRNEFYAQLVKQCTYVVHRCTSPKLSSSSSGCSPLEQRSSLNSLSPSSSECQFVTDVQQLDSRMNNFGARFEPSFSLSHSYGTKEKNETCTENRIPPSQSELLQVIQIMAVAVSLNLPRGRMRWWLMDVLRKFANPDTNIGKYALFTLNAIDRTVTNGTRDNVPSRTEIMSILLRNPYDHSNPHSLPVNFSDGSYLVVGADGSTTVEEFMSSIAKDIDVRHSLASDFYLFADDPSGTKELHILEPQRKVLDIVGWWEQTFRRNNSGRYQNTKVIKLICKKRLVLRPEPDETNQERFLIVHQMNQEVISQRIPLTDTLSIELGAIMAQLTFGDYVKTKESKLAKCILEKIKSNFISNSYSQINDDQVGRSSTSQNSQLIERWQLLCGRSTQDCVRVYLNCLRRLITNE